MGEAEREKKDEAEENNERRHKQNRKHSIASLTSYKMPGVFFYIVYRFAHEKNFEKHRPIIPEFWFDYVKILL